MHKFSCFVDIVRILACTRHTRMTQVSVDKRREKQRERTDLNLLFFAGKAARSGFPVMSLFFVITDFQIGVDG